MSEDTPRKRRPSPGQVLFLVLGGLVFYFLSPGPVLWLLIQPNGEASPLFFKIAPFLSVFYYPVDLLQRHVPYARAVYEAWYSLFGLGP